MAAIYYLLTEIAESARAPCTHLLNPSRVLTSGASRTATCTIARPPRLGIAVGRFGAIEVFGLEHPLHDKLFARIGYEFARQSYTGAVPFDANFHRNRVSIGITVHWNAISLKH